MDPLYHPLLAAKGSLWGVLKDMPPHERFHVAHTLRVRRWALDVGNSLGLNLFLLRMLEFGALMHDVVKILPAYRGLYAHKKKFTLAEAQKSKSHPYASAEAVRIMWEQGMLNDLAFEIFAPSLVIIAGHHWWYRDSEHRYKKFLRLPQNRAIRLEEICRDQLQDFPLQGARILKVVDYFVARQESRGYNTQLSIEPLLAHMSSMARSQFEFNALYALSQVVASKSKA